MPTDNPYTSPTTVSPDPTPSTEPLTIGVSEFTNDAKGNIGLTSKIVKIAAVFSAIASLSAVMQIWAVLRFYGLTNGWTQLHTLVCLRIVYTPCWLLLAWTLWRYGKSLDQLRINGIRDAETAIEQQAKLWLAIGLLIFVVLVGVAVTFGNSMANASTR